MKFHQLCTLSRESGNYTSIDIVLAFSKGADVTFLHANSARSVLIHKPYYVLIDVKDMDVT